MIIDLKQFNGVCSEHDRYQIINPNYHYNYSGFDTPDAYESFAVLVNGARIVFDEKDDALRLLNFVDLCLQLTNKELKIKHPEYFL